MQEMPFQRPKIHNFPRGDTTRPPTNASLLFNNITYFDHPPKKKNNPNDVTGDKPSSDEGLRSKR